MSRTILGALLALLLSVGAPARAPAPLAFVSNERSGTVTVVDTGSDTVVAVTVYLSEFALDRPPDLIAGRIFSAHIRSHLRPANRKASRLVGPTEA